jgi:muramoyltetrapeptide carboxypeptidase LdcA involved in peptidoglycan recycling
MLELIKPQKLHKGDTIAAVSLSWGGAGDEAIRWRYEQGKERLEKEFGLRVIEMPFTLKGSEYIYQNPKKRAEDLMDAFKDPNIKGIFSCIGGDDSIRILPYIDFDVIRENPKIFMGYSDSTITHYICLKAGISSFYGPAILVDFAENVAMSPYTIQWINKVLFEDRVIGNIEQSEVWTSELLPWEEGNKNTKRKFNTNNGYQILQGRGSVKGRLIGGCIEVMEFIKGTTLFPNLTDFDQSILFLETSEEMPNPDYIKYWLRNYGAMGILNRINGIIFAKPYHEKYFEEYKKVILMVMKEYQLEELPILYNLSFGHCEPKCVIPYGVMGEIDCDEGTFSILESGVRD